MNDIDLVLGLKSKEEKAFNIFVENYSSIILKVLSAILNIGYEKNSIEDAYNEILICIWNNIDKYNDAYSLKTWVIAITKYRALDFKRKLKKSNESLEINEEIFNSSKDSLNEGYKPHSRATILEIIAPLKEMDKDIFLMYYYHGYSAKEISKKLKMTEDNIFKRLSRGRQLLKKHYGSKASLQDII